MLWKLIISIILILISQAANYIAVHYFSDLTSINPIASWGISAPTVVIYILTAIAFIFVILIGNITKPRWPIPIFLILAGGISNLIDRIIYGGVVDYFDIKIIPIFNIADILISIGVIWLVILILVQSTAQNQAQKS